MIEKIKEPLARDVKSKLPILISDDVKLLIAVDRSELSDVELITQLMVWFSFDCNPTPWPSFPVGTANTLSHAGQLRICAGSPSPCGSLGSCFKMVKAPERAENFPFTVPAESARRLGVTPCPTQSPTENGVDPHRKSESPENPSGLHPVGFDDEIFSTLRTSAAENIERLRLNC